MKQLYTRPLSLLFFFVFLAGLGNLRAQCPSCTATTFNVNLSAVQDSAWTIASTRSGNCCTGSNCVRFNVTLNPASDLLNFDVTNPSPSGSAFYQINCGPMISIGTPACITGLTTVCITYCKPGGDNPTYHITATRTVHGSNDITLRQGCSGTMSVTGLQTSSIQWTSIYPGVQGAYNSYLSCVSACASTTVTPAAGAPAYIDYMVSGSPNTSCPGTSRDTIRVYTYPGMTVGITPTNPVICSGGPGSVSLTANPAGGAPPYSYSWSNGATTQTATVSAAGTYTVSVSDGATSCPPITATVTVAANPTPSAPSVSSNSPVCLGSTINLSTPAVAGATYSWTGPGGFTSTLQNPTRTGATLAMAGTYSLTITVGGCTSPAGATTVVVNSIPSAPTASSNSPVCTGSTLNLSASTVSGATYSWAGPNGFTSAQQNDAIAGVTPAAAGTYSVTATVNGCTSSAATTTVTVNTTPSAPTASSNSPVCAGSTLNLSASTIAGATYSWTGPNSFTSSSQNPSISNTPLAAAGTYSVTATVNGCTSAAGTTSVTVNPIPAAPTASSNSPVCTGTTLTLSASAIAGATYSWTGPNGFASSSQNPSITNVSLAAAGTYSVTATVNGCTGSAGTTTVVVNQTPSAPSASSNSPVCTGSTLNLSAATVAGATYSWTGPNGFASSSQNPNIAGVTSAAAGTYSVTVTVAGCGGSAGTTAVVVNTTPAAPTASSNSPICVGATLNLNASAIAGATYSWTGPNSFTASTQNTTIPGATTAATGTYSVTATVNGCTGPAGTVTATVNSAPATPVAGSNSPVCTGTALNLTASTIAGATYSWTGPNSFTSTSQNPTISSATAAAAGTYSVVANNGCASNAATVTVTVNATPATPTVSSNSPVCAGTTLNLSTPAVAGATYSWTGPNSFTSSSQNPSIAGATTAAAGTYSVTVTVNGCTSAAGTTTVVVNPIPAAPTASSNSPVCTGTTLNLSAGTLAGATYSWSGPNSFTSSSQNPGITNVSLAAAGTYSVTATVSGCTGPAGTTTVVVNQTPAAPAASSNTPVCTGTTLNLSAATIAGATYSWTGPNGFASSSQNPSISNVTLAAAGTYSVTATVTGCTGTAGTTAVVVNQTPAAPTASSNSPVCEGATLNLFASAIAGATYSWTGPNGFVSSSQNPSVTNVTLAAAGTYSVTATVNGCTGPAGTVNVIVNPIPAPTTASSNSPVCTGQAINLSAATVAGATYSWTGPGGYASTAQNPVRSNATTAMAGTYSVTVTVSGCSSSAATTTVVVNTTPATPVASNNGPLCVGSTLNLNATTVAGATYSWTGPNGFTSSTQANSIPNVTTAEAGTYSVTITAANGCTSAPGTTAVVVNTIPAAPTASSNSSVCTGTTLNLTAGAITGATYSWTGPNGFASSSQNPAITNVTLAAAGTYSVTATVSGCTGSEGTTTVVVNQTPSAPTASSNTPVCTGSVLNLSAATIAGATYTWTGPNGFTSSSQNPSITNVTSAEAGTYSVTATVSGCTGTAGTTSVIVNQTPPAPSASSNSPLCVGGTLNLTASTVPGAAYSWNGPNGFTSSSQNPSITNVAVAATGTYSVTSTVNGCTSIDSTVNVTINNSPATPVASSNSPVCSGSSLNLFVDTIPGATYSWTGPNGFASTSQDPVISSATLAAAGTYSVTAFNGCSSNAATVTVTINPTPAAPSVSSNSPVCEGATLNLNGAAVAGATYSWNGPNGFTSSTQNNSIPNATAATAGTYSLTVTVNGCTSPAGTVNAVINQPAVVNAGTDQTVCANNGVITLGGSVSGGTTTGQWSSSGTGTFAPDNITLGATYTPSAGDTAAGSVTLTLVSTNNGACPSVNDAMVVTITDAPTANAGPNQTVCANNAAVSLNGSVTIASGGIWSSSGTGTFTPDSSALNATYIPSAADTAAGTITLTLTTTGNGGCNAVSDAMVVTITDAPVVNAGASTAVCVNNPNVSLNGSVSGASTTGTWTTNGTGTFTPDANTLNATYVPSAADVSSGSVVLTLTSTGIGSCSPVSSAITVTFTPQPVTNAGADQTVCANNAAVALSGTVSGGSSTGQWTTSGTGTFAPDDSTLNTTYIPSAADTAVGTVTLTLTSTNNGGCVPVSDAMVVTITDAPRANAGPDASVCANNASIALNGSVVLATGGVWSTSGTGTFTPGDSVLNATYMASAADTSAGSVTLYLTTTGNGLCNPVTDSMIVTITDAPVANAGPDQVKCKGNPNATLNGAVAGGLGTGIWSTLGSGTFSPNNTTLNAVYIPSTADTSAGTVTLVLTSTNNGGCNAVTDTMVITYTTIPVVTAGSNVTVCANNAAVALSGSVTGGASAGIWTSSGTGTFTPSNTALSTTYDPSAADTAAGSVTLTLTSTNGCIAVSDNLLVTITDAPAVDAGTDQSVCANNATATLSGSVSGGASTGVWSTSGTGTFTPNTTSMNVTYTPSAADIAAGSVTVLLTSTGNGQCNAVTDTVMIIITPPPSANAGVDQSICANGTATLNGTITGGSGNGQWSTSGSGVFSPISTALNATYIPSNADTAAGSVVLVLTSINNGGCIAAVDTMILTITDAPVADAGTDQTVCANNAAITLSGGVMVAGGGGWTTSGDGTFADTTSLGTVYTPGSGDIIAGNVTLYLTTTNNGGCIASMDSMTVTITPAPVVNAGADIFLCTGTVTASLNGSVTGGATTGQWTTLGSGTFTPNDQALNATYNLSSADTAAGMVKLVLTSTNYGNCLPVTDTVMIKITTVPLATAGADQVVCANNPVISLSGSIIGGSGTGQWTTNGTGTFTPSDTTLGAAYQPSAADTANGSVVLVLTATQACMLTTDTMMITITDAPDVNAGANQVICGGDNVNLAGTVSVATGAMWVTNGDGTFMPNDSTLTATYVPGPGDIAAGNALLVLTTTGNGLCNAVSDSMVITIGAKPVADIYYTTICSGQSVAFIDTSTTSTGSIVSWAWDIDNGNTFNTQDVNYSFNTTGIHTVQLIVANNTGCIDTALVNVYVNPVPVADFTSVSNCNSDSVQFNDLSAIAGGSITSWSWNFGDTTSGSLQNPAHHYNTAGTYTVTLTVTSDSGCTASKVMPVITNQRPVAGFASLTDCSTSIAFSDTSTASGDTIASWSWNFGDGNTSTSQNPTHTYSAAGTYTVSLVITTTAGCSDTVTVPFTVDVPPVAAFTGAGTYNIGQPVSFTDQSVNALAWNWSFGDSTGISTQQDPAYTYTAGGTYTVILVVTNSAGCTDSTSSVIIINDAATGVVAVPSAFTPNGDGINDVLYVRGGPFLEINFRIFNEWGNQVFVSTDQSVGWDGIKDGAVQPAGAYIYIITGRTVNNEEVKLSGDVTIIR